VQRDAAEPLQVVADPVAAELEAAFGDAMRRAGADPKAPPRPIYMARYSAIWAAHHRAWARLLLRWFRVPGGRVPRRCGPAKPMWFSRDRAL